MTDTMTRNIVNDLDVDALTQMAGEIAADPSKAPARFGVTTRWTGQTRTESTVHSIELGGERIDRSFKIVADEPEQLLGANSAPNPQELLLSALNACMTVGYVAGAAMRGITLTRLEIETTGELDLRGFLDLSDAVAPGYPVIDYIVRIAGNGTPEQFEEIHAGVMATSPNYDNIARAIRMNGRLELG